MSYRIALRLESIDSGYLIFRMPADSTYNSVLKEKINKMGDVIVCDFSAVRKRRTTGINSQNHHLNGHIMQIMRELGMTSQKEYDQVKTEIKRIAHFTFGYPSDKSGHFFKSEADCNTEECGWLIEASHLLAADLGIVLMESEHD